MKFNKHEISLGTKVELEHTKSKQIAKKIAKEHLKKYPKYYTEFAKFEKNLKRRT